MIGVYNTLTAHFLTLFAEFLSHEAESGAVIFDDSSIVKKRYLDGGCEYTLDFKVAFRGFFGHNAITNSANRAKQELLAESIINGDLPILPHGLTAMTLDVTALTSDCIDIRNETARYCIKCRLTFFGEG